MRIAVISDTHLQSPNVALDKVFDRYLAAADVLLHCGDVVGEETLAFFHAHPCFYGVRGNMDFGTVAAHLPASRVVDLEGRKIGMVHNPGGLAMSGQKVMTLPFEQEVDLICCGHLHERMWMRLPDKTRLLNPGSLFLPRDGRAGFAVLHWNASDPEVEWVDIG